MDNEMIAPEVKADMNDEFRAFMGAFEVFRETNDKRLAELEKKGEDCLTVEKLSRVEAALDANQRRMDELVLKSARPSIGGASPARSNEGKSAFDAYVRSGDEYAMRRLEAKAMVTGGEGNGLTAPAEVEDEVMRRLMAISPFRSIATVRTISAGSFKKAVARNVSGAFVGEEAIRTPDASSLKTLNFPAMELYAMPAASSTDDERFGLLLGEDRLDLVREPHVEVDRRVLDNRGSAGPGAVAMLGDRARFQWQKRRNSTALSCWMARKSSARSALRRRPTPTRWPTRRPILVLRSGPFDSALRRSRRASGLVSPTR